MNVQDTKRVLAALYQLEDMANNAISHVGAANYRERQEAAHQWIAKLAADLRCQFPIPPAP